MYIFTFPQQERKEEYKSHYLAQQTVWIIDRQENIVLLQEQGLCFPFTLRTNRKGTCIENLFFIVGKKLLKMKCETPKEEMQYLLF